jgi:hypothetical protein
MVKTSVLESVLVPAGDKPDCQQTTLGRMKEDDALAIRLLVFLKDYML